MADGSLILIVRKCRVIATLASALHSSDKARLGQPLQV